MKKPTLNDYCTDELTKLHEKYGLFFAFTDAGFEERKAKGTTKEDYIGIGYGGIIPKKNLQAYNIAKQKVYEEGLKQMKQDHTQEEIIKYELKNHECYYLGYIDDNCMGLLKEYGYTEQEVIDVFGK